MSARSEAPGVAIIGLAGRFPGARNVAELWRNLCDGVDSICRLTDEEILAEGVDPRLLENPSYVRSAAPLDGVELFDAPFFNFTPREAEITDPQHRLFLECACEALECAGHRADGFEGAIGVYAGAGMNRYLLHNLATNPDLLDAVGQFQLTIGNDKDYLASRVAYKLNLNGPAVNVQTACSSSLVAVSLACQSLLDFQCDMALAGGVAVMLPQRAGYRYQEGGIASRDGRCRAFDAAATGTVFGSGVGVLVLRRLEDALAAGDEVYAVVRGFAVNNDGAAKIGYTAPSVSGQAAVISEALSVAEVDPATITYVEGHGTATPLGDPIEVAALTQAFRAGTGRSGYCALGSVKSNVGHLDVAAGAAGLIKAVLALRHRLIPPSLHFTAPNPELDLENTPFYVNSRPVAWSAEGPLRAGVSSFGIGGTNAHLILEEAPPAPAPASARPWHLLVLSARTPAALAAATANLAAHLRAQPEAPLADVAFTLQTGRAVFEHRRVLVAADPPTAAAALEQQDPQRVLSSSEELAERPIAFLFPGQGAQYVNMGRELLATEPLFRRAVERSADWLFTHTGFDLREVLYPQGGVTPEAEQALGQTAASQLALFVVQHGLARLLMAWGIKPQAMLGHSLGEYVAACLAGVFTREEALALIAARGRLIQALPPGTMLAVELGEEELRPLLGGALALAAVNGALFCSVAGPTEEVAALAERLAARGVRCRRLHTSHAFHSAMMDPALQPFAREVRKIALQPPQIPYLSNLTGRWITPEEAMDPDYWVQHLRRTVRFSAGLAELMSEPRQVLLTVGPARTLDSLAQRHPAHGPEHLVLAALPHPQDEQAPLPFLLGALGRLWLAGVAVDWKGFYGRERRRRVQLPTYPFERRSYWITPGAVPRHWAAEVAGAPPPAEAAATAADREAGAAYGRPALASAYAAPRHDLEHRLVALWQEILGVQGIGIFDDFFALGGHSLLATQVMARVHEVFQVELPLRVIFTAPTVATLAAVIGERRQARERGAEPVEALARITPDPAGRFSPFPLTDIQQAYWLGRGGGFELGRVSTHLYTEPEIDAGDLARVHAVLQRLIERHDMLRAVVLPDGRQKVLAEVPPYEIAVLDLRGREPDAAARELAAIRERMSHQVLPSERWPLFEIRASRLDDRRVRLHISFDFLIGDAWSLLILNRDAARLYRDPEAALEPLAVTFRDYVLAEIALRETPLFERSLAYWRSRLEALPPAPQLPLAVNPATIDRPTFVRRSHRLSAAAWERFKARAAGDGLTPSAGVLAAFAEVLARWSKSPTFTLNLTLFNRLPLHPQINQVVGDFTTMTLLAVEAFGDETFAERARRLQQRLWDDLDHRYVGGVRVLRELAQAQGRSARAAMPVVFTSVLHQARAAAPVEEELEPLSKGFSVSQTPQVWLDHQVIETGGTLVCNWDAVEELFPPRMIDAAFSCYCRLLDRLADADTWEAPVPPVVLTAAELQQRLEWNATEAALPSELLQTRFEGWAAAAPDRIAVIAAGRSLAYGDLDRAANRLARRLRQRGARPNRPIAVAMEKGWEQVLAVLGVLKAGAPYLPVDPALPGERQRHLLQHGEVELALVQPRLEGAFDWPAEIARIPVGEELLTGDGGEPLAPVQGPEDLAYVLFTSGSTGRPKGVMIPHRGPLNTALDVNRRCGVTPDDRVLALSALGFDLSVYDLFGTLAAGGAIVMPEPWAGREPGRWAELIEAAGVTLWNSVPALLEMLVEHAGLEASPRLRSLRLVLLSGDWIPVALPDQIRTLVPAVWVISLGGPTEASIWQAVYPIAQVEPGWRSIPYGRPLANQRLHVLDHHLDPRPVWVPGEIFIGGAGLADGYWRDEDKTRASFVVHPRTGERLLRSGDWARHLPDGTLEFLGREDFQVKIQGHRIELGEVEAALAEHPSVQAGVVAAVGDQRSKRRLVGYVVPREGAAWDVEELRAFLRRKLPDALVPALFVQLAALPLSANGKVDRGALPAPELEALAGERRPVPPGTLCEELLVGIWCQVLGVDSVGIHEHFFELGGDSLLATQVISRVQQVFRREISLRLLFEGPTIAELAARLEQGQDQLAAAPAIAPVARQQPLLLSFAQQRLWFADQWMPGSPLYNIPIFVRLSGHLDRGVLQRSLSAIVARHEILRTTIHTRQGEAVQVISPPAPVPLPVVDLSGLPPRVAEPLTRELATAEVRRPFRLAEGPLLRCTLLTGREPAVVLLMTLHHIVGDGWSIGILLREIAGLYGALYRREPSPFPDLPIQYADFADWQRRWLQGEVLATEISYWKEQLAGAPKVLELPTDRPRPAVMSYRGARRFLSLPQPLAARLGELSRAQGGTLFMVLLAGLVTLLQRYTEQRDLCIGTPVAGRTRVETEGLIGFFLNNLVLRLDLRGARTFGELLALVRAVALQAQGHQALPFEKLLEELAPERSLSHTPLFQVVFSLQTAPWARFETGDMTLTHLEVDNATAMFDLTLSMVAGERLGGYLEYSTDLFDGATVARMQGHLEAIFESVVADPEQALSSVALLGRAERSQLLVEWNDTSGAGWEEGHLAARFEEWAQRSPDAVAVVSEQEQLSYGELNRRANRLAHQLRRLGVGAGSLVGVVVGRSGWMVTAVLGVAKSGGGYVPLDVGLPPSRMSAMLSGLGVEWVVADAAGLEASAAAVSEAPSVQHVVVLGGEAGPGEGAARRWSWSELSAVGEHDPERWSSAEDVAYVIFTSGSTGRPKGVMLRHGPVMNVLDWVNASFGVGVGDRLLFVTSLSFDLSVYDIFGVLSAGGTIRVAGEEAVRDPELLLELLAEERITCWDSAPAALGQLVPLLGGVGEEAGGALRLVLLSGDWIPLKLPDQVRRAFPGARVIALGGATEAAIWSNFFPIGEVDAGWSSIPYGRPIRNARYQVLDGSLGPVALGVAGDLYIGGGCLACGYAGSPEQTAERFVPDPYGPEPGGVMYSTGDRARWRRDGTLEFLGRRDHQVKVRGFRIELGEIESVLQEHGEVGEAVVVALGRAGEERRLVGYVVGRDGAVPGAGELRRYLQGRLPEYMVPGVISVVSSLPLTSNGKVDRGALSSAELPVQRSAAYAPPRDPVEELLAGIWQELLRLERVGVHDNFFALGGDSISSIQMISKARQAGLLLTPRQVFQAQTIAEQAILVREVIAAAGERATVHGPVPITPIQAWFFEQDLADPHHFNQALLLELEGSLTAGLLARALAALLSHHDALRLRFERAGNGWHQVAEPQAAAHPLAEVDLSALPSAQREQAAEGAAGPLQASLDLAGGPLHRFVLWRFGAEAPSRLLLVLHHLLVDGVSWRVLLEDLLSLCAQLAAGGAVARPHQTAPFKEWAERLRHQALVPDSEAAYWLDERRGRVAPLPVDREGEQNDVGSARGVSVYLDEEETEALVRGGPGGARTQVREVLLTALALTLAEWAGSRLLLVDLESHGREEIFPDLELFHTVGWFTTIAPIVLELEPGAEPGAALRAIKEQVRAIPRQGIGYGLLRYGRGEAAGRLGAQPSAEVIFNYLGNLDQAFPGTRLLRLLPKGAGPLRSARQVRRHLLEVNAGIRNGRLGVTWEYGGRIHRRSTIERLTRRFSQALRALLDELRSPGVWGLLPSDVPLAQLSQAALDRICGDDRRIEDLYPLSPLQQGMLFHSLHGHPGAYFLQVTCKVHGRLDEAAFERAWQRVVDRHPALRQAYVWEGLAEPLQVVRSGLKVPFEVLDWRGLPRASQEQKMESFLAAGRRRGLDLATPPLLRITLIRLDSEVWQLVWEHHHLLLDGWSLPLLYGEVFALYEAERSGGEAQLPPPRPFRDYIAWLRARDPAADELFWRRALKGFASSAAPAAPAGEGSAEYLELSRRVPETAAAGLRSWARRHEITLSTVVQGAWALLQGHLGAARDLVFGVVAAGRPAELLGTGPMVGVFINTLPVRVELPPDAHLVPWLQELHARQFELREHGYSPLVDIQKWSEVRLPRPLFEAIFVFENYPWGDLLDQQKGSVEVRDFASRSHEDYPIVLRVEPAQVLTLRMKCDARRFRRATIEHLLEQLVALLSAMVGGHDLQLADLQQLLAAADAREQERREREVETAAADGLKRLRRKTVSEGAPR